MQRKRLNWRHKAQNIAVAPNNKGLWNGISLAKAKLGFRQILKHLAYFVATSQSGM
jgi:hypothetical protein